MNAVGAVSTNETSATFPQPRLIQAAHEFEAQLMKELLKPITAGAGLDGAESDTGSEAVLGNFATEALGQALSRQGGLGIATNILHSLSRNEKVVSDSPGRGKETNVSSLRMATRLK